MNFLDMFNKKKQENDATDPGIMLPKQDTQNIPAHQSTFDPNEIQMLLDQLQEQQNAKPKPSEQNYGVGTHLAAALGAYGSALKAGAGIEPGDGAGDVYRIADKARITKDAAALSDWTDKNKDIRDRITTKLALGEHLRKLEDIKAKRAKYDQITPYQQQQLNIEQDRLNELNRHNLASEQNSAAKNGAAKNDVAKNDVGSVANAAPGQETNPTYVKTMNQKQADADVKLVAEEPNIIKRQEYIRELLGDEKNPGLIDTLAKNSEIGTKWQSAKAIAEKIPGVGGILGETFKQNLSPNQQRFMSIAGSMAQDVINDAKGVATDSDRRAAEVIISGSLTNDPEAIKQAVRQLQDYQNRVQERINQAKTRMGQGSQVSTDMSTATNQQPKNKWFK